MFAIIAVAVLSFLLYITGAARRVLNACKLSSDPEPTHETPPAPPKEGRKKWETEAAYILKRQGMDPDTVQYMGDEMLTNIIREYLDI